MSSSPGRVSSNEKTVFSQYQIGRFRLLFSKYASLSPREEGELSPSQSQRTPGPLPPLRDERIFQQQSAASALAGKIPGSESLSNSRPERIRNFLSRSNLEPLWVSRPRERACLSATDLHGILLHLGPPVGVPFASAIISSYDTSLSGSLDFEDFLTFLGDYGETLRLKLVAIREKCVLAPSRFDQQAYRRLIASLCLDDLELWWSSDDKLTNDIRKAGGLVTQTKLLNRTISVYVHEIANPLSISQCATPRLQPSGSVAVFGLNPFVRITLANSLTQCTAAKLCNNHPRWHQALQFQIKLPDLHANELLNYIAGLTLKLELCDYVFNGLSSYFVYAQVIARGELPLVLLLRSPFKDNNFSVTMRSLDGATRFCELKIALSEKSSESNSMSKVIDAAEPIGIYRVHASKRKEITGNESARGEPRLNLQNESEEPLSVPSTAEFENINPTFFSHYFRILKELAKIFPRREYMILGLDHMNYYRALPSFLAPSSLYISDNHVSLRELAETVSEIPFFCQWTPISIPHNLPSNSSDQQQGITALNKYHDFIKKTSSLNYSLSNYCSGPCVSHETSQTPIRHPSLFLIRGYGSLLEHAILLCSTFLAAGAKSFVALGIFQSKFYSWVISVEKSNSEGLQVDFSNSVSRKGIRIWDILTGNSFRLGTAYVAAIDSIHTVFSNENIFLNIQRSTLPGRKNFSWDFDDPERWLPVSYALDESECCAEQFKPFYLQSMLGGDLGFKLHIDDSDLLIRLSVLISTYRRAELFCESLFHPKLSRWLEGVISKFSLRKESESEPQIERFQDQPDGCVVSYRIFKLWGTNATEQYLLHALVEAGVLDCAIPESALGLALKSSRNALGFSFIWLGIATIYRPITFSH